MVDQDKNAKKNDASPIPFRKAITILPILVANAVPVFGVWFLGWQPLKPIFFYWFDGLLAILGLGVVAGVVTFREDKNLLRSKGIKLWLSKASVFVIIAGILAIPSIVIAMYIVSNLYGDTKQLLLDIFSDTGVWSSLIVVVLSHAGQTIGELRWKPELTMKESGQERGNLYIHRTLVMGLLVFWEQMGQPPRWALAVYVLVIACLFTFTQIYPERYLHLIGFSKKTR